MINPEDYSITEMYNISEDNVTSFYDYQTSGDDNLTFVNGSYDNESSYDYYDEFLFLVIYHFEEYMLGYVHSVLILLTAITNVFVIGYFLMNKNRGKATNLLFVSIAFSDTMTGVTLLPNSIGVYATKHDFVDKQGCNTYMNMRFYVSAVFHTVSIWQTVVLCIQRYLCICHPLKSRRICTFRKTFISIIVMYCCAILLHVYHLLDNKLGSFRCRWKTETPCNESCIYLWFCVILKHLLPCILLVSLTSVTILELKKAQENVSTMFHRGGISRSSQDKVITYTAAIIVLFFLIPELPYGVYRLIFVITKHMSHSRTFSPEENHIIICAYELALTISFSANFWIYCFKMHDFRYGVFKLLTCGAFKGNISHLRTMSKSSSSRSVGSTV